MTTDSEPEWLFRFGRARESASKLDADCKDARNNGFPHGVSVFSYATRKDAARAARLDVELYFVVLKTGGHRFHYTIELPDPVSDEAAERLNRLFGREGNMSADAGSGDERTLRDSSSRVEWRLSAARNLSSRDEDQAIKALIAVAGDASAPAELATEAGRSLAQICARRNCDVDELVMANMTENAYLAYDGEIARLQNENPALKMRRGKVGSGL